MDYGTRIWYENMVRDYGNIQATGAVDRELLYKNTLIFRFVDFKTFATIFDIYFYGVSEIREVSRNLPGAFLLRRDRV